MSVDVRFDGLEERLFRLAAAVREPARSQVWAAIRELAALREEWVVELAGALLAAVSAEDGRSAEDAGFPEPGFPETERVCAREGCDTTFDPETNYEGIVRQRGRARRYCSPACQTQARIPKRPRKARGTEPDGTRACSSCGQPKPEAAFQLRADTGYRVRRGECDDCRHAAQSLRYLSVAKTEALNRAGLSFVVRIAGDVAGLVCSSCGQPFRVGDEVHADAELWHTACPAPPAGVAAVATPSPVRVRPGARGRQDDGGLKRSYDRKVSPRGTWQESRRRWIPSVGNSFGLPSGASCPGRTRFCVSCYAESAENSAGVRQLVAHNLALLQEAGTVEAMAALLEQMVDRFLAEAGRAGVDDRDLTFRIHWDGDFFSVGYAQAWRRVIEAHPEVQFWAYTRSFADPVDVVSVLAGIPNLALYLSADRWNRDAAVAAAAAHPVRVAWCSHSAAAARTLGAGNAIACPENAGRMALMAEGRGACLDCRVCVDGRRDVLFATTGRAAPAQPPSASAATVDGDVCANPDCENRVRRRPGPGRPPLFCSQGCAKAARSRRPPPVDPSGVAGVHSCGGGLHLGAAEPAVPAEGADGGDLARPGPAGDGLRVDTEHGRYLTGGEKVVVV